MKYIYGPVKSRRLGLSLGVSLSPYKICDFDCIYCQLGKTKELFKQRKEYVRVDEIIIELKSWLFNNANQVKDLGYITIAGLGEPTLNSKIGELIKEIKKISTCHIAVITNASLFSDTAVRLGLSEADLVVPSLDSVSDEIFQKINRPHQDINIDAIIKGLEDFRNEFQGEIWLEVMLVEGVNDDLKHMRRLKEITDRINPDKIQLNSPVRSTAEPNVQAVDKNKLQKIKEILGNKCEVI